MHPQARTARERLTASGFDWRQFYVSTLRYTKKEERARYGDYGPAVIIPRRITTAEILQRKDEMLKNGFSLQAFVKNGEVVLVVISSDGLGWYQEYDITEEPQQEIICDECGGKPGACKNTIPGECYIGFGG